MTANWLQSLMARRSFLSRLGLGVGIVGATAVGAPGAMADTAAATSDETFRPARHAQDDWLDKIPGVHRCVFDCMTPQGFALALQFANNYYNTNQNAYSLKDGDSAVLIIARHHATSLGYKDAIWAKYGKPLSEQSELVDPKTKDAPTVNLYAASGDGLTGADALIKRGVQFGICNVASRGISGRIAKATGGDADAILAEIGQNLIPNARFVPAGIVAVNRAQERGYSLVSPG
jgi:hypothetical protein